jgi:hypothetical protein
MALDVSQEVKDQTTKCWREFGCLSGNGCKPLCSVESCLAKRFLFLNTGAQIGCPYRVSFGFKSQICSCPVRNTLFRQHGV